MMNTKTKAAEEINEMVNIYLRGIDNDETPDWDTFDSII